MCDYLNISALKRNMNTLSVLQRYNNYFKHYLFFI